MNNKKTHTLFKKRKYLSLLRIKNLRFILAGSFIFIWTSFIDSHKLIDWLGYRVKTNKLLEEKAYYLAKIKEDSIRLNELNTNSKNLEKYAREKYLMKKNNEEIFIVKKIQTTK